MKPNLTLLRIARFLVKILSLAYHPLRKYVSAQEREIRALEASAMHTAAKEKRQALCLHIKGGRGPVLGSSDYAVSKHTHIDGHIEIRCLAGCSKLWTKDSPDWQ